MKSGTPGFSGERLREAREARAMSMTTLADLVGLARQSISAYEHGELTPQSENLHRIASVLNMPVLFFVQPARLGDDRPVFFRSLAGATKSARLAAERRLAWIGDIVERMSAFVDFPALDFPALVDRKDAVLDSRVIEDVAIELRREWDLGDQPIHDTVTLIEQHGGIVTRSEAESASIDAFSSQLTTGRRPGVFLGNEKGSAVRSRFDACHEIGHMVMHQGVSRTQVASTSTLKALEAEANAFASAFLLPASSFAEDLYAPTLDGMRVLKPKWKASIAAMVHRASDLRIISDAQAHRLWINRSARKWNRVEPGDDVMPFEEPSLLRQAFALVVENHIQSASQLLDSLPFSRDDVRKLASLPDDFLGPDIPVLRLRDQRSPLARPEGSGTVIPFDRRA